jgi:ribose transport system substrate-binding protein
MIVGCGPTAEPAPGDKPEPTASTSGETEPGKKFKIAVSIPTATHGWTAGVVDWANKTKEKLKDEAEITIFASESVADQATKLGTMATQGYDALVILSFDPAAVTPAVKTNRESFGYVVSVDRGLAEPVADVWMRGDNLKFGTEAATFMAEKLGGGGNILVLRGMAGPVDEDRVKGFQEVLNRFPGIKVLDMQPGEWNQDKAMTVTKNMLIKHKNVQAIWAADDDMALGAEKAVQQSGQSIWIVGGGGSKVVVERVMKNDPVFPATVTYSPKMIELAIQRCLNDLKAGKKPSGTQIDEVLPVELVTPANAKDHHYPDSVY